ncbi:MAG: hypothetical protein NVS4B6_09370 [Mycobacterium sp.]
MPLQPWMQLISVDDHLIEHPTVWSDRLPTRYLDAGPRIIEWERPDNGQMCQVWQYEGRIYPYIGLNAVAGKRPEEYGIEPVRHKIGLDNITWECNYPHSDSYWPQSRERAAQAFENVPDDEVHQMVELNTRKLYNFPRVA